MTQRAIVGLISACLLAACGSSPASGGSAAPSGATGANANTSGSQQNIGSGPGSVIGNEAAAGNPNARPATTGNPAGGTIGAAGGGGGSAAASPTPAASRTPASPSASASASPAASSGPGSSSGNSGGGGGTAASASPSPRPTASPSAAPTPLPVGAAWLTQIAQDNLDEIALAQVALQRSSSTGVRALAQTLINDHQAAAPQIQAALTKEGLTAPTTTSQALQDNIANMAGMNAQQFNSEYLYLNIVGHQKDIDMAFNEATVGTDAAGQILASNLLPTLRMHLQLTQNIAANQS